MLALRWIAENLTKYRETTAPTAEKIHAIDYNRRLGLLETACKLFSIPMEVRHVWSRMRFFPWFSSDVDVLVVHGDEGSHEEASERLSTVPGRDRAGCFQKALANHRNAITTGWKRVGRCLEITPKRGNQYWRRTWRRM